MTEASVPEEPKVDEVKHPIEQLSDEQQIQLWKVRSTNFELSALNNQLRAMDEALKRANIEAQTLPGKMKEVQKTLESKRQGGQVEYIKLKELLDCPEGKDIDLDTGLVIK